MLCLCHDLCVRVCVRARAWPGEQDLIYQLLGGIPATPVASTACKDHGKCLTSIYINIHIHIHIHIHMHMHMYTYSMLLQNRSIKHRLWSASCCRSCRRALAATARPIRGRSCCFCGICKLFLHHLQIKLYIYMYTHTHTHTHTHTFCRQRYYFIL